MPAAQVPDMICLCVGSASHPDLIPYTLYHIVIPYTLYLVPPRYFATSSVKSLLSDSLSHSGLAMVAVPEARGVVQPAVEQDLPGVMGEPYSRAGLNAKSAPAVRHS